MQWDSRESLFRRVQTWLYGGRFLRRQPEPPNPFRGPGSKSLDGVAAALQPGALRRFAASHPRLMDWLIVAVYLLLRAGSVSAEWTINGQGTGEYAWLTGPVSASEAKAFHFGIGLGATAFGVLAIVLWRRRRPLTLMFVAVAADFLVWITAWPFALEGDSMLVFIAMFAVAQRVSARAAWVCCGLLAAELGATYLMGRIAAQDAIISAVVLMAINVIFVHLGNRGRYVASLVAEAKHLAVERDQRAQIAVADERARIAREMHDIVAHSLSVMITLTEGAAAQVKRHPEAAETAIVRASDAGRTALADMRRALAVLRGETETSTVPQPGSADLVSLVGSFRQAGLPVTLDVAAPLPDDAGLGLAIYRIVQESLTNTLRYAPGSADVTVRITADGPDVLVVAVDNRGGLTSVPEADWDGSGGGLVGMRQRVAVYGGTLEAGPVEDGWSVKATLHTGDNG
jgi:signal transduction histidine kinase